MRRRDLFRFGGIGAGGAVLGAVAGAATWRGARSAAAAPPSAGIDCGEAAERESRTGVGTAQYGAFQPPEYLPVNARDLVDRPPAAAPGARRYALPVVESTMEVARDRRLTVWTYAGSVPGPVIRANLGERLEVVLDNRTGVAHSVHFHGAHDVMQDGLTRVAPGESRSCTFEAGPVGLHPYHCHVPPYTVHLGHGMFGAMIVDPPGGRPAAHEFVLCLCGFDTDGDGRNDVYAWNGIAGWYERYPLKVPVGELVRLYLVNMVEIDPVASFHLHAQTFDLFRSGTALVPTEHTDLVTLGQAERAIIEFRLPRRGRYMFHPHQSRMAQRGAMGWIVAV
jgi:FtsP/CotA-like multicopper oxidase with cupredoxin domain